jgi:xylan 1,4-beta-xylosidase
MSSKHSATLRVDCAAWLGPLRHIWTSIGFDEINWTYTPRGKELLKTLRELAEAPYYVRNHNTFTSGNGLSEPARGSTNVYHEMPDGSPRYDWTIIDRVYDAYTAQRFRPIVELGFLPHDMVPSAYASSDWSRDVGTESYESDGLWKYPPKDFSRWADLVMHFIQHCAGRYGAAEVSQWYFELWNEPDIQNYWRGSLEDYCRLYDFTVDAAVRALAGVRIGGPGSTSPALSGPNAFLSGFLEHCTRGTNAVTGQVGTRLDFVSFHTKGAFYSRRRYYNHALDIPKESPSSSVMMGDIRAGLETINRFPELHGLPVFVDECDPAVGTIYGEYDNPNFVVTNSEYYPAFLCSLAKRILDLDGQFGNHIDLMTTWAFLMEGKRFFEGNRTLVTNENVEKPVLNAFRMLSRLGHTRIEVSRASTPGAFDATEVDDRIDALASLSGNSVAVLVWNQTDPWWEQGQGQVTLQLDHLPFAGDAVLRHYRIDGEHSNAYAVWDRLGRPQDPSPAELAHIRARQGLELLDPPLDILIPASGTITLTLSLPLHSVSLLELAPTASRGSATAG